MKPNPFGNPDLVEYVESTARPGEKKQPVLKRLWRWLTGADERERMAATLAKLDEEKARNDRLIRENRADAWRELASLERRGILTPTVKYRTLEWLTRDDR